MSKLVNEVVADIKTNSNDWVADSSGHRYDAIRHKVKDIKITGYGNTRVFSVVELSINGIRVCPLGYYNAWKLEVALKDWYKNIKLSALVGGK